MEEDEGMINIVGSPSHPVMEVTPVGSPPEDLGFPEAPPAPSASAVQSSSSTETIVLTDDLRDKIIRQVEYYFSDENLPTDKYLMKYVKKNKQGYVPIAIILSFKKMKKLVQDISLVVAALKESSQLVLSSDGKKVKRIHPLLATEIKDAKSRTVFVENLPENCSTENLLKIFGEAGKVINICIRDPHAMEDSTKSKTEMVLSGKVHALVEYETVEAADKAVGTLNDEENWRSGLRVELLQKRMNKYGLPKRGWKGAAPEKNNNAPAPDTKKGDEQNCDSIDHHNDRPDQEEEEHLPNEKVGRSRGRNRGRKTQKQQNTDGSGNGHNHLHGHGHGHGLGHGHGHGHGHGYVSSSGAEVLSKPPPGPKMPDGTKGFAMGRGRPLSSSQN